MTRNISHEHATANALETWVCDYEDWKDEPSQEAVYNAILDMDYDRAMFTHDYQLHDEHELHEHAALIWEWIQNGGNVRPQP